MNAATFQFQRHFDGCIPTCAVAALSALGVVEDECDLYRAMPRTSGNGFANLRVGLSSRHPTTTLYVVTNASLVDIVHSCLAVGLYALVPHRSGARAHCVLALGLIGDVLSVADPWPGHGFGTINLAAVANDWWAGECAIITHTGGPVPPWPAGAVVV